MVSTWNTCSIHMETMWCPPGNHMVSTWKPHGVHVDNIWFPCEYYVLPCENHIVCMWTPCGFHMDIIRFPCEHNVVSRWTPHGFNCGHHVVSRWMLHGSHRTLHRHHMIFTWTPCGVQETTWKPAQKQPCIKPTGFLVCIYFIMLNQFVNIIKISVVL